MPYVPSKKTDGVSRDREILDTAVEIAAVQAADATTHNLSLISAYKQLFFTTAVRLSDLLSKKGIVQDGSSSGILASAIFETGDTYGYEGAYLGEFNYAFTRFIQRVPQIKVERKEWKDELRYWVYAATVEALTWASVETRNFGIGVGGVFEDIKDEYKRRVNTAYEAAQIVKSGDCYDAPYYTRLVRVVDEDGNLVGYQEVMLKRGPETVAKDMLDLVVVLRHPHQ